MEDKNSTNNRADDDILESKADILHAGGDDDDDINIFEDDDLEDSSFEITLEDSEVEIEAVEVKPERAVPKFNISERILVNERRVASGRRQKTGTSGEKNETPEVTKPKVIIPEATGSMGVLLNEAKKKRGGEVKRNEMKTPARPIATTKKKIPIVELPGRTIKDVKITSETVIKQPAVLEEVNDLQQQIISEIVAKDLARFCGVN